ncbi:hypothetical protein [Mycolicibacterium llatzerense]|uniref:hypothetical protein n=1 Tax=Mycolicibacterium llatzerense TaxID=280871 RepID=UPI0008DD807A|nr:hypothetical protein [Mycolicibacterium llatzerense]
MTNPAADHAPDILDEPIPETAVLHNRKLNPAADPATLSSFADDWWNLAHGVFESHYPAMRLNFLTVPESLREAVKHYVWQLINHESPRLGRKGAVGRLALTTISTSFRRFVTFALWLDSRGIKRFVDVTTEHLDVYLTDVLTSSRSNDLKASLLAEVVRFWGYRSRLPEPMRLSMPPPWDGTQPQDLVGECHIGGVNRTPRIHTDTIDLLLMWSLRFVDTFADDIIKSFNEYLELWRCGTHINDRQVRAQAQRRKLLRQDVVDYLDDLRSAGGTLPGRRKPDGTVEISWSHLIRRFQAPGNTFARDPSIRALIVESGIPVSDEIPLTTPIAGAIDGQPWMATPITYHGARQMAERLRTACFVVITYLSGMRPGEALNLERGCASHDPETELWMISGRKFKGARGEDGEKLPEGQVRDDPWVTVEQSVRAVAVLERLHEHSLLFPTQLHPHAAFGGPSTLRAGEGRKSGFMAIDIANLIEWINNYAASTGRSHEQIPADPEGHIAPSRFRRTLAWHIVRKPRGLIAGAIQYGHLHVQMTLGYSGTYDSGFPDEQSFEEWLFRLDELAEDHELLRTGEQVSGPSASTYRQRIDVAHQKFAGRVLKNTQQARDMLANPLLQIFTGKGMTCVFDQSKALCQTRSAEADPRVTPDQDDCRPSCHNIAYTDRDISQLRIAAAGIGDIINDSLAPSPRHQRASAELARLQQIIDDHDRPTERQ